MSGVAYHAKLQKANISFHLTKSAVLSVFSRSHLHDLQILPKFFAGKLFIQIISGTAPQYLAELVHIYILSRSLHSSSNDRTFCIPTFKRKEHGGQAVCFSAGQTWNSLPFVVCHTPSLPTFKANLKTHLFRQCFD